MGTTPIMAAISTPSSSSNTSTSQTSPSSRPPPYIPPPPAHGGNSQQVSPQGGNVHLHPTLTTAVIKDGPKLMHQSTITNVGGGGSSTPSSAYATWERTLKSNNSSQQLLNSHQYPHQMSTSGISSSSSLSGSMANLNPHR